MTKRILGVLAAILFLMSMVDMASALPITYSFEGIGSGSLNNVSFVNTEISFDLHADTDNVILEADVFKNNVNSSDINITGFSTASFTTPGLYIFMNSGNNALGFTDSVHFDLLDIKDDALTGYNLATAIGVIYEPDPFAYNQFNGVATTQGSMSLSNVDWVNFSAKVVPEPASLGLIVLFASGIWFTRRFCVV